MPKCDFSKVTLQLYWNHTSAWVVCCKFAVYFQNIFSKEHIWVAASVFTLFSFFTVSNSLWFDLNELLKTPPILEKFFACWDQPYYLLSLLIRKQLFDLYKFVLIILKTIWFFQVTKFSIIMDLLFSLLPLNCKTVIAKIYDQRLIQDSVKHLAW